MKQKPLIVGILAVAILAVLGGAYYVFHLYQQSQRSTLADASALQNIQHKPAPTPEPAKKEAYFGTQTSDGSGVRHFLVNLSTKQKLPFVKNDYQIIDEFPKPEFPGFLVLRNVSNIYSYEVATEKITDIPKLKLKNNEDFYVQRSLTEPDKFYFEIYTFDPTQPNEMGGPPVELSTRSYFYDAPTGKVTDAGTDLKIMNGAQCIAYDSKNARFFAWPCGEGIGAAPPIKILDLLGRENGTLATQAGLGLTDETKFASKVLGDQGHLVIAGNVNPTKRQFIWFDIGQPTPTKTVYSIDDKYLSNTTSPGFYSIRLNADTKTIAIGEAQAIVLLRYDEKTKTVMGSKTIEDSSAYPTSLYAYQNILYYQPPTGPVKAIDLTNWQPLGTLNAQTGTSLGLFIK